MPTTPPFRPISVTNSTDAEEKAAEHAQHEGQQKPTTDGKNLDNTISMKIPEEAPETEKHNENDRDPEYQAVEIIFDPGITSKHRRKSSNVNVPSSSSHNSSSCFIHALLEAQRAAETGKNFCMADEELHRNEELGPDPGIASRTLTKVQLTDLALGVRELSKRFVSMEIRMKVKTFLLLTKPKDGDLTEHTRAMIHWLLSNEKEQYIVYVDEKLKDDETLDSAGLLKSNPAFRDRLRYWTPEMCRNRPHTFDFVITLGGDGTVLYASWLFQKIVPPVLSFALGSLGFLTKFNYKMFPSILDHALNSGITISLRLRFEGTVMRSLCRERGIKGCDLTREVLGMETDGPTHRPGESFTILNEVVVDRGPNPTMSSTELYGDDEHLSSILADGICISTPTGSTAYSLAAGGSLCHPEIPSILVSPICPHSLTFRPLILPDSMVLRVGVPHDARTTAWASFDGRQRVELQQGDYITISASRFPFPTIQSRKQNKDWFDSISRNFNWGTREKQKPMDWQ